MSLKKKSRTQNVCKLNNKKKIHQVNHNLLYLLNYPVVSKIDSYTQIGIRNIPGVFSGKHYG